MRTIQAILALTLITLALAHGKHSHKKHAHKKHFHGKHHHRKHEHDPCRKAYNQCDWEFYGYPGKIPVFPVHTKPDRAFTPRVVSKNPKEKIGILNTNDIIPEFIRGRYAVPITKFGHPKFTPTHFKPFAIDYVMGSGVGHQTFHGNQKYVARGQCVRVFFSTFQKLTHGHPPNVDNINVGRYDYKCVVFRLH